MRWDQSQRDGLTSRHFCGKLIDTCGSKAWTGWCLICPTFPPRSAAPSLCICGVCVPPTALASSSSDVAHEEARMAGTLEVTDELCWMPAGWVFDTVLERMAAELHSQAPGLAARLLAARTEANGGYLDLRDTDPDTLVLLVHAADSAYGRIKGERAQRD